MKFNFNVLNMNVILASANATCFSNCRYFGLHTRTHTHAQCTFDVFYELVRFVSKCIALKLPVQCHSAMAHSKMIILCLFKLTMLFSINIGLDILFFVQKNISSKLIFLLSKILKSSCIHKTKHILNDAECSGLIYHCNLLMK